MSKRKPRTTRREAREQQASRSPSHAVSNVFALIEDQVERIAEFAKLAAEMGHTGATAMLVFVEVDGPWRRFVERLAPGYDWTPVRALGGPALLAGIYIRQDLLRLGEVFPDFAEELASPPASGWIQVMILLNRERGLARAEMPAPAPVMPSILLHAQQRGSA